MHIFFLQWSSKNPNIDIRDLIIEYKIHPNQTKQKQILLRKTCLFQDFVSHTLCEKNFEQESIPVGCVPPACWRWRGCCLGECCRGGCAVQGVCVLSRGWVCCPGVCVLSGVCCLEGVLLPCDISHHAFDVTCLLSLHQQNEHQRNFLYSATWSCGLSLANGITGDIITPCGQTDRCKNITFPQLCLQVLTTEANTHFWTFCTEIKFLASRPSLLTSDSLSVFTIVKSCCKDVRKFDSMNTGKSSQLEKNGFGSLHTEHVIKMNTVPLIHCFEFTTNNRIRKLLGYQQMDSIVHWKLTWLTIRNHI